MKLLIAFLFISISATSQKLYVVESNLQKPASLVSDLKGYQNENYFVFDAKDKDSIILGLEKYLPLIVEMGISPFRVSETKAGNTTIKVSAKKRTYADRYNVSAETVIDDYKWNIVFGTNKNKSLETSQNIRKFIFFLKSI